MTHEEIEKGPRALALPKKMKWPKKLLKEIEIWDTLHSEWDTAHAELEERLMQHAAAVDADAKALRDAVAEKKSDPGTADSEEKARAIVYWGELTRQARRKTDQQLGRVLQSIEDHRRELVAQACQMAKTGADSFAIEMGEAVAKADRAVQNRNEAYEGLRFVARLTADTVAYEPVFPLEGQISVPQTHERRALNIVALLEAMLQREENGQTEEKGAA